MQTNCLEKSILRQLPALQRRQTASGCCKFVAISRGLPNGQNQLWAEGDKEGNTMIAELHIMLCWYLQIFSACLSTGGAAQNG